MYVRRVHKYAVVWVLRNYITCTNLIGAALLTFTAACIGVLQTLHSRVKGLARQTNWRSPVTIPGTEILL